MTFEAAFDRLHRDLVLLIGDARLTFNECLEETGRRKMLRGDDLRFLDMCRSLRNFLAHSHDLLDARMARVDIDPGLASRLIDIANRVSRRVGMQRFMVPWQSVRCGKLEEPLEPLMTEMIERDFSHIPIMASGIVTAIFDERALFRALASDRLDTVVPSTRLADIIEVGAFLRASPEEAGVVFVGRRASLSELRERIAANAKAGERISLIIVTETGDRHQRPIGLMTIWDLPEY